MATVFITHSFQKELGKQKNLFKEILSEVSKYERGIKNLVDIFSPAADLKVLKGYLAAGRTRVTILLRISKKIYIPFFIAKKESRIGWNISKYSEDFLLSKIHRTSEDIQRKKYKEFPI